MVGISHRIFQGLFAGGCSDCALKPPPSITTPGGILGSDHPLYKLLEGPLQLV